jgi:hypothetical protein
MEHVFWSRNPHGLLLTREERWLMTVVVGHEADTFTLLFLGPPHFLLTVV